MERKRIPCLFLFVVLILISSSCHPRHVSDIKKDMTKEEVVSLWGKTGLITHGTVKGRPVEIWEYHFSSSGSVCRITFSQDRVAATQCHPMRIGGYGYYYQSGRKPVSPSAEQGLVREGSFALELVEALKIGEAKGEAEAESALARVGIAPRNGWIADYPMTPDIIAELQNAIGAAADSGKLPMKKDEAIKTFQGLVADIETQYAGTEPPSEEPSPPEPYYYSYPYNPYYYPYYYYPYPSPYFYFRYHPFRHYHWR